jgi:glycerophosphoryl diester phosphodiesterase
MKPYLKRKSLLFVLLLTALLTSFVFIQGAGQETGSVNPNYRSFADTESLQAYMKWHPYREPLISAHRGGPMAGFPENALETFDNILNYGPCLIECDVRMTADGHLVMMHDSTLERTSSGNGKVSAVTLAQIKQLFLRDPQGHITRFRVPTFDEVLEWALGRAILTVDVKRNVPFEKVIAAVRRRKAEAHAIIIVYNLKDLKEVHRLAPELMMSGPARGVKGTEYLLKSGIPYKNLCAFVGSSEPDQRVYTLLHRRGIRAILGTMHNLDNKAAARGIHVYQKLYKNGADILATDNVPLVSRAIAETGKRKDRKK